MVFPVSVLAMFVNQAIRGNMTLHDRMVECITEMLGLEPEAVTPEADFVTDLGADSLDMVDVVMALEEEFGMEFPDEEIENLKTVGALEAYLRTKMPEEE